MNKMAAKTVMRVLKAGENHVHPICVNSKKQNYLTVEVSQDDDITSI